MTLAEIKINIFASKKSVNLECYIFVSNCVLFFLLMTPFGQKVS